MTHAPACPAPPLITLVVATPATAGGWRFALVAERCPSCGALTQRAIDNRSQETP